MSKITKEEICKELSKYYNCKVYYEKTKYNNRFHNGSVFIIMYENGEIELNETFFNAKLTPKLFSMLGKFYEKDQQPQLSEYVEEIDEEEME